MRFAEWALNLLKRLTVQSLLRLAFQEEKGFTTQVKTNKQKNRVDGHGLKNNIGSNYGVYMGVSLLRVEYPVTQKTLTPM